MTEVLTTVQSTGITLTSAGNPLTITATGGVDYVTGTAIYGPGTQYWSVVNNGTVTGLTGVSLSAGGYISNASFGVIDATGGYGVDIAGPAATVVNAGSITATASGVNVQQAYGTVINSGTIISTGQLGCGVYLRAGGTASNAAGAFIEGQYAIAVTTAPATIDNAGTMLGKFAGIYLGDGGTIINSGMIIGGTTGAAQFAGITLADGGYVSNASSGTINSTGGYGVDITGGPATVVNAGSINATKAGVSIQQAPGTVINSGSITSTGTHSYGVQLTAGGTISNAAGGFIEGHYAIAATNAPATIDNAGTILGNFVGIYLGNGGVVTNAVNATITNVPTTSIGIYVTGAAGTVTNYGTISGYNGVVLKHGGTLTNSIGGRLGRNNFGIGAAMTGGTVINAGYVGGILGLDFFTLSGVAINTGTILGLGGVGVKMPGGTVINAGFVSQNVGLYFGTAGGTAFNTGTIVGGSHAVWLAAGGYVSNASAGLIESTSASMTWAVRVDGASGTVLNAGTILAGTDGVVLDVGGTIANTGLISGGSNVGVYLKGGGTVTNSGTIAGGSGGAVQFAGTASDRLVITPGAVFQGAVTGGTGINTMELAGTSAATLSGLGSQFTGFSQFVIDSGANWTVASSNTVAAGTVFTDSGTLTLNGSVTSGETIVLSGSTAVLQLGTPTADAGVIATLAAGDTIVLDGIADATAINVVNGNTLAVSRSGNPVLDLTLGQAPSNEAFGIAEHSGNAVISVSLACFAGGTCLDTPDGPRPVEQLQPGDRVRVAGGGNRPVRWVGYRRIDLPRQPHAHALAPVIVKAHAFADSVPRRDTRLSPDHAVLIGGMLIPIRLLLNDGSIRRDALCQMVTYYHVELDAHDILLAEGLPAESYLDTGNRAAFENGGPATALHPDFDGGQSARLAGSCAPFTDAPEQVEPAWRRLAERSEAVSGRPWVAPATTQDADLRVVAGTLVLSPVTRTDGRHVFVLPPETDAVRLASRSAVPSETRPWIEDRRRLGVMVSRLTVRENGHMHDIPLDHPALGDGWWAVEQHGAAMRRWTDGSAFVPVNGSGPLVLQVDVAATLDYPVAWQRPRRAA